MIKCDMLLFIYFTLSSLTLTFAPSTARCKPATTTVSFSERPFSIILYFPKRRPDFDMPVRNLGILAHDHHIAADQVRADCAFGHEQRALARFARKRNRPEHSGGERAVCVAEIRAHRERRGVGADLVVAIVKHARIRLARIFEKFQFDLRARPRVHVDFPEKPRFAVVYDVVLADFEVRLNRVVLYDCRKYRGVRDNEVADVHELLADSPRNGRADIREVEVQLRIAQNRLRAEQRRIRRKHFATAGVENLLRDYVGGEKLLRAPSP